MVVRVGGDDRCRVRMDEEEKPARQKPPFRHDLLFSDQLTLHTLLWCDWFNVYTTTCVTYYFPKHVDTIIHQYHRTEQAKGVQGMLL